MNIVCMYILHFWTFSNIFFNNRLSQFGWCTIVQVGFCSVTYMIGHTCYVDNITNSVMTVHYCQ